LRLRRAVRPIKIFAGNSRGARLHVATGILSDRECPERVLPARSPHPFRVNS
jgi:hypothetical protein